MTSARSYGGSVVSALQQMRARMAKFGVSGLEVGIGVRFVGTPIIDLRKNARAVLGDGVVLNSSNRGYHAAMASPVKLMADRAGAVISIGSRTRLNGATVHAWNRITIGDNCLVAAGVQIFDANGHALAPSHPADRLFVADEPRPIRIEDNVWLGLNVIILPGSSIGEGSVIAAGSIVSGDIPAGVLAAGQPARVVRVLYAAGDAP
jgi:carbonic anhydrase/acetyltransferase-like protein (isoleucine patch superfamily)